MNNQENYKCPCCGGNLKLNINGDKLKCHYCGYENKIISKVEKGREDKFFHLFWFGTEKDASIFDTLALIAMPILSFIMLIIFVLITKK